MSLITADIIKHYRVAPQYRLLEFNAPELADQAKPGQFVHVKCGSTHDPLLRRPISIHRVNRMQGTVSLLYRIVGRGTELLSAKKQGEKLDVIGPLGNGFQVSPPGSSAAVIAGGIGIAPLFFLLSELVGRGCQPVVFLGARSANDLLLTEEIKALGVKLHIATDDGTIGHFGLVTDLLADQITKFDFLYACGPLPMMKQVAHIGERNAIPTQVSLEERMGCGVGACLACTCRIKTANGSIYKRVCTDGPVFKAAEVVWNEQT